MRKKTWIVVPLLVSLLIAPTFAGEKKKADNRPFCKTVDEAARWVLAKIPAENTARLARFHEKGLISLHLSLGMWIRNNIPVWGNDALMKSLARPTHPDSVGEVILKEYWRLARLQLPEAERKRIEFFEQTYPGLKGSRPNGSSNEAIIADLNTQIRDAWPKDAPYPPFTLVADPGIKFFWKPEEMGEDLKGNVSLFLSNPRSIPYYEGDTLRVGNPGRKSSSENPKPDSEK